VIADFSIFLLEALQESGTLKRFGFQTETFFNVLQTGFDSCEHGFLTPVFSSSSRLDAVKAFENMGHKFGVDAHADIVNLNYSLLALPLGLNENPSSRQRMGYRPNDHLPGENTGMRN
jgi:hypothetical protein